ncbi:MAG: hypothetical protein ACOH2J_09130 [Allorhizobium sp.]
MTQNSTKTREQAELAFGKTQTQFLNRNRTISEIDDVAAEREAKTARLREQRLEHEANAVAAIAPARKKTTKG